MTLNNWFVFFQFEPNHGDFKKEMSRQLDILNDLHSNRPIVDKTKAANLQNRDWETARFVNYTYSSNVLCQFHQVVDLYNFPDD